MEVKKLSPRTRGDGPDNSVFKNVDDGSPPHVWGWTFDYVDIPGFSVLSPARGGMDPQ